MRQQEAEFEPVWAPPKKAVKHPVPKLIFAFVFTFLAFSILGVISFPYSYSVYLHPPNFPFQYTNLGTCLLCNATYFLGAAIMDFVIWFIVAFAGVFVITALLTANSTLRLGSKLSLPKKKAHVLGFLSVAVILFSIFAPVIPSQNGQFTGCSGFAPNQHCVNETQFNSITYSLFCEGAVWDYPTTAYTFTVCLYG